MSKKDIIIKDYMRDKERFADAFNGYLYNGKRVIRADQLKIQDTTELGILMGEQEIIVKERIRDVLKEAIVMTDEDSLYFILGIENQSEIHYAMPVRTMICDALNYVSQIQEIGRRHKEKKEWGDSSAEFLSGFYKNDKLKPAITLTIYWGTETWDGPKSLYDMFPLMKEEHYHGINDYKLMLLAPNEIQDYSTFRTELGILFKFLALAFDKKTLEQVKNDVKFENVSLETVNVIEACTDIKIKKVVTERGGIDVCKAWQELKQDYLEEGERLGLEEGKKLGREEGEKTLATLISRLLNDGLNDVIKKITEDIPLREAYYKKYGIK